MTITVSALYHYPVKSCAGLAATQLETTRRGFIHDREFMLVDSDGLFLSQREQPRLALIQPTISYDSLTLTAPAMPPLELLIQRAGARREAVVWRDACAVVDQGDVAAQWLSDYLQIECRLVRMADEFTRRVDPAYAQRADDQVSFADGYPFLLISEASLADLNSRLPDPLPMNRFRPNIVIAGCEPFAEDGWQQIRIGEMVFDVAKPCARCVITTVDQTTAETSKEPLKTLATYRAVNGGGVMFGQNLLHQKNGLLQVGETVSVIKE